MLGWLFALTMVVTIALVVLGVLTFDRGRIVQSHKFVAYMWVAMFVFSLLSAVGVA